MGSSVGGQHRTVAMTTVVRVTRAHVLPASITAGGRQRRSRALLAVTASSVLALAACGGGDDDADTTTVPSTSTTLPAPIITEPAPIATTAPITTSPASPVQYVTEGASVMVVNASRIDGAAGRLSERLAAVEFVMVDPGNYTLGQLDVSKIYVAPGDAAAQAVAESLKAGFGGGSIEVLDLPAPPPTDSGSVNGATVLVAMGNDIADKTLDELQGITPPPTSAPDTATGDDTATASETASDTATG
jgi:hypothetical protein